MSNIMKYKGFFGSVNYSAEDEILHGKLEFITDLITYESDTVAGLREEFQQAVTDYISLCEKVGKEPSKPYKGSFNVRLRSPDLHSRAARIALSQKKSLNFVVEAALEKYVREEESA